MCLHVQQLNMHQQQNKTGADQKTTFFNKTIICSYKKKWGIRNNGFPGTIWEITVKW